MSNKIPCGGFSVDENSFEKAYVDTTEANIESKVDRLADKVAQITPDTIDTYVPVNVGEPIGNNHAATRKFVEDVIDKSESGLKHDIELLTARINKLEKNHPKS